MVNYIITGVFLALPMVIGGVLHMIFVKKNWLKFLTVPVSTKVFGANKTWRGFIVMPLTCTLGVYLVSLFEPTLLPRLNVSFAHTSLVLLGVLLGLGYTITELPNSMIKRRMGIAPGTNSTSSSRWFFIILDQIDSGVGCAFVYSLIIKADLLSIVWFFIMGAIVHLGVNMCLYAVGLKKQRF
jgi:CDP-diacylglycerol--serine O-phosphatidyltransferase